MLTAPPAPDKTQLRRELRARRQGLSPQQRQQAARRILQHIQRQFRRLHPLPQRVAVYAAVGAECPTQRLLHWLYQQGIACFLPIVPRRGRRLRFRPWSPRQAQRRNQWRILEPVAGPDRQAREMDLMFMPLLGFGPKGERLGMGGGYYDCTLSFSRWQRVQRPHRVGLAYAEQALAQLPSEAWDIRLHAVVTPQGWQRFHR